MNDSTSVVLGLTSFFLLVVLYVWWALALSAVFRKAGEAGWKAWVPLLNQFVVLQLGGFSGWMILIVLVPVFGPIAYYVVHVIACYRINRAFGFGAGMTVLAALLPVIWASVVGFGSARWIGEAGSGPVRAAPVLEQFTDAASSSAPLTGARVSIASPSSAPPAPASWPSASAAGAPAPSSPDLPGGSAAPAFASPGSAFPPPPPPAPASRSAQSSWDDELEDSAVDPEDRIAPLTRRATSFAPSTAPAGPPSRSEPVTPIASVPGARAEVHRPAAEAPVTSVPTASAPTPPAEPWAPSPDTAREPRSTRPEPRDETFPELSEAVSAVAGAPDAGSPRSARSSVSALYAQPEVPATEEGVAAAAVASTPDAPDRDDDLDTDIEAMDRTVIARRRRVPWVLIPPGGAPVDLTSDVVILGRRPAADPAHPGAQLVSISDETRTVSKTHARLRLRGETWFVTDLGSTNGVLFATLMGTEVEAQPGQEIEAGERFFLGDAEVRLARSEA